MGRGGELKLAIFDDVRAGIVDTAASRIVDVSDIVGADYRETLGAGWWVRLCRDLPALRPRLDAALENAPSRALDSVRLRAAALNPSKIVACASNYAAHVDEMMAVQQRVAGGMEAWMAEFDVFLKAPSSIIGPGEEIIMPPEPVAQGLETHHECELTVVIGRGGASIPADEAFDHILGYTIALDITVRGKGDRSRRKSYDTFTPVGPWVVTADEIGDAHALDISLAVNGETRQNVNTSGLTVRIPEIIAYASSCMRLEPGDLILTGAPPGVGQLHGGEQLVASISGIGAMPLTVRRPG